jgi:uncharacterized membrane protein YjfL (UPF0719 family)
MLVLAEEMGGDEVLAGVAGAAIGLLVLVAWYLPAFRVTTLGRTRAPWAILFAPALALGVLVIVLALWSAKEVRFDVRYIVLFMVIGAAWLGWAPLTAAVVGLAPRPNVLERRNAAADFALGGAVLGFGVAFAAANIGEGPTIWTTIGPALLATVGLAVLWTVVEILGRVSDAITIDRDVASGVRLGAFLIAAGLVLGRAVAGDWESADGTLRDFWGQGWPAAVLAAAAIVLQWAERPRPTIHAPSRLWCGLLPGVSMLLAAVVWLYHLRWP